MKIEETQNPAACGWTIEDRIQVAWSRGERTFSLGMRGADGRWHVTAMDRDRWNCDGSLKDARRVAHEFFAIGEKENAERLKDEARRIGAEHGASAATWYEIGSEEQARKITEDIDPEIVDGYPTHGMSGEFADSYMMRDLLSELDLEAPEDWLREEIFQAYEDGFHEAVSDAIDKQAHAWLEDRAEGNPDAEQDRSWSRHR